MDSLLDALPDVDARALQGCIDVATASLIEGWVWDPQAPEARIRLELLQGDRLLAVAVADRDRPSLVEAGVRDGLHAFRIELPAGLVSRDGPALQLRCAASFAAVPGSPFVPEPDPPPAGLRWHVDEITDAGIVGWVFAPADPSRRCIVALREGAALQARAVAGRYRPGLAEAGLGDGRCAFLLPLPHTLLDGEDHALDVVEEQSGLSLTPQGLAWRSQAGTAGLALTRRPEPPAEEEAPAGPVALHSIQWAAAANAVQTRLLFDISDLVYWIGGNPNLTGIQRVQSSIVLALLDGALPATQAVLFLSYNTASRRWEAVPVAFLAALLRDLFLPELHRIVAVPSSPARDGHLPGARPFDADAVLGDGVASVLCLLGAGWNKPDHLHRILGFKRRFATRFAMLVHDLVPIYARETCDEPTAAVFEAFLRRAVRHVDHWLAVSANTARDLCRYMGGLGLAEPAVSVTRNGASFDAFLPPRPGLDGGATDRPARDDLPSRFVLFVSTIEGRKNHLFLLDLWRRLVRSGDDPPHLICVGRVGWRAERFLAALVESHYLDGRIILLQEVSDAQLQRLYETCLFTVYPSLYEGWGLPVGESLAAGKICVCSDRAALPEVAEDGGICLKLEDPDSWYATIRALLADDAARQLQEAALRATYRPETWHAVAARIAAGAATAATCVWPAPYPHPAVPYATEISFALAGDGRAEAGGADSLLTRLHESRRGHFLPAPLTDAAFRHGEEARGDGLWAEPEPWGTWLCDDTGELTFGLGPSAARLFYVFLRLRASGPLAGVVLRFVGNGEMLWQGSCAGRPQNVMLRSHRRPTGAEAWRLTLRVEAEVPAEARRQVAAMDGRVPMIGFERLVVVAEDDVMTRVDVLTWLQMGVG